MNFSDEELKILKEVKNKVIDELSELFF
jgi:hypothetical protein